MADSEWKERKDQIERYRVLEREITDPLAAVLIRDIVLELEADLVRWVQAGFALHKP